MTPGQSIPHFPILPDQLREHLARGGWLLREQPWESTLLGKPTWSLNWTAPTPGSSHAEEPAPLLRELDLALRQRGPWLISCRVPALGGSPTRALEELGFHLVECFLELEHPLDELPPPAG